MTAILILGESGTGKSSSMRNLDPQKTLLIQMVRKPLPFRSKNWTYLSKENQDGSVFIPSSGYDEKGNSLSVKQTLYALKKAEEMGREIVVIDDFQYLMSGEFMDKSNDKGFQKFTDIGRHAYDVLKAVTESPLTVYVMAHTETTEFGKVKIKTIGKLLDEKITIEGLFTIVLRTSVQNGHFLFSTQNNGNDTVKSPMGMFENDFIDNDLLAITAKINEYYGD